MRCESGLSLINLWAAAELCVKIEEGAYGAGVTTTIEDIHHTFDEIDRGVAVDEKNCRPPYNGNGL